MLRSAACGSPICPGLGLNHHRGDVVAHDVVQLPGEAGPLLQPGGLAAQGVSLLRQLGLGEPRPQHQPEPAAEGDRQEPGDRRLVRIEEQAPIEPAKPNAHPARAPRAGPP